MALRNRRMNRYLRNIYGMVPVERNFGYWRPHVLKRRKPKMAAWALPAAVRENSKAKKGESVLIAKAFFDLWPGWNHGLQGTGDCVSWGQSHMGDVTMANIAANGKQAKPDALICQESIYGFGKCELVNNYSNHGAGMYGEGAAAACTKFGTLYRKKYPGHDLTSYSGSRAVAWGERPRTTHGVPDELEEFAAEHKWKDHVVVTDAESGIALLRAGYAWNYCGYTYWGTTRNSEGIATRFQSGWHSMTCTGVMVDDDDDPIAWWIANTGHGNHCNGPVGPFPMPTAYAQCGSWVPDSKVRKAMAAGDCPAATPVAGWPVLDLEDWGTPDWL